MPGLLAFVALAAVAAPAVVDGSQQDSQFGVRVAAAGDVDGDGHADLLVGAPNLDAEATSAGGAYLYAGCPEGVRTAVAWSAIGTQEWALFGRHLDGAGDVNGDGFDDVIVGATGYANGQADEGAAFLYAGSRSGLSAAPVWSVEGEAEGRGLGVVAGAGDVNGDRYADVVVGAPSRAWVYHGGPRGLSKQATWAAEGRFGELFGVRVSPAGDVNGDGFDDVLIGAGSMIYAFHGSRAGLGRDPAWEGTPPADATTWGSAMAAAGDVDGDGFDDVLVAANQDRKAGDRYETGSVFLYRGSGAGLESTPAWTYHWASDEAVYLGTSIASAGDTNGDGYADVVVGAPGQQSADGVEGRVLVFRGSATGLSETPYRTLAPGTARSSFGWSVAGVGDVDGGGVPDLVVGDPTHDAADGRANLGGAYLFLR